MTTDQQKNTIAGNSLNAVEREPVRLGSSIQKHAGSRDAVPLGGIGGLIFFTFYGLLPTNDKQTPPLLNFIRFLWTMRSEKNILHFFFDIYFSSYREKFIENWGDDVTK